MKKHCYMFLLASIFLLASQSVHGHAYTSPRMYDLERYILSADPVKQKTQIAGDLKELALRHEGKTWKAKAVRLWNWAKRNPGKATICGLATAAALGGVGYLAWNHWHLPAPKNISSAPSTPALGFDQNLQCSAEDISGLYIKAQKCTIKAPNVDAISTCIKPVQSHTAGCTLPKNLVTTTNSGKINTSGEVALTQARLNGTTPAITATKTYPTTHAPVAQAPIEVTAPRTGEIIKQPVSPVALHNDLRESVQSRTLQLAQQAHDMLKTYTPTEYPLTFVRRVKETAQKIVDFARANSFSVPQAETLVQEMTFAEQSTLTRAALATNSIKQQAMSWWNALSKKATDLCNANGTCSAIKGCVTHPVDCGTSLCKAAKTLLGY